MLIRPVIPFPHYRSYSSGSSVENTDLVLFHNVPESIGVGIRWHPFKHKGCCPVSQRAINYIGMSCHPANVGSTPESIFFLHVKNPLKGLIAVQQITCLSMENSFGLPSASTGIQYKERVLSIHNLGLTVCLNAISSHLIIPPVVTPFLHSYFNISPLDHYHVF